MCSGRIFIVQSQRETQLEEMNEEPSSRYTSVNVQLPSRNKPRSVQAYE